MRVRVDAERSKAELFSRLSRFARRGRVYPIAAQVHHHLVAQELVIARLVDSFSPPRGGEEPLLRQVTAVIKTFERPQILRRLVASIKRRYPTLRIIVVDDSRQPTWIQGVETIAMPYDSGVSAGRNAGLRHVTTKYVLVLDDDLVFFRRTALSEALELMENYPKIDIMGGQLIQLPFFKTTRPGRIFQTNATPTLPLGSAVGNLNVCQKVNDFFLARRDRLLLVPWDAKLKRAEYADFFTRTVGLLTTVHNPDFRAFHARTPFDPDYMKKRLDLATDRRILQERYPLGLAPPWGARSG